MGPREMLRQLQRDCFHISVHTTSQHDVSASRDAILSFFFILMYVHAVCSF